MLFPESVREEACCLIPEERTHPHASALRASFELSPNGEVIFLIGTDANLNAVLDSVMFGVQQADLSYERSQTIRARL